MADSLAKEVILIKKRFVDEFIKGSTPMLYHIVMVGLSAALALSLPMAVRFMARQFLFYWSRIGNDKIFFLSVEIILTVCFILLSAYIRKSWKDRKLSNMARAAGMVFVTPAKGFFMKRRIRKLKESQGIARDVMVICSTGFRTFVDPKGELHQVIQSCRKAKIMLLNPNSEGAIVRAKGIPDPGVTPETFGEQIRKSIDFLKFLKGAQKNVRLKLYPDPPFLKMTILGDFIWLQHYQPGLDVQSMPRYVFKHDPNIGGLYFPFYQYFLGKWNNPRIPEYDLETDELVYRDMAGNEVRREKMNGAKIEGARKTDPTDHMVLRRVREREENETFSPLWPHENRVLPGDFPLAGRQNFQSGLHPGGKEFSLLRSKNPICETAGWIAIL
jgi:hypothetical protein